MNQTGFLRGTLKLKPESIRPHGLGTAAKTDDELHLHMRANKTECALAIFSAKTTISYPDYISRAIAP